MADLSPSVEYACLDQFVFELIQGLGPTPGQGEHHPDPSGETGREPSTKRLLDALKIPPQAHRSILSNLQCKAAGSSSNRFHCGLMPLLPEEHGGSDNKTPLLKTSPNEITQTLSPYLLHDTLILDLESSLEQQPVSALRSCPVDLNPSLGQCYLLLVVADSASDALAHAVCQDAFGIKDFQPNKAELLGAPIWEFVHDGTSYYVWIRPSKALDGNALPHILNRLCCRAKIDHVVDQAAAAYHKGLADYQQIEGRLAEIQQLLPNTTAEQRAQRIALLEEHLSALPHHSHGLARSERDLGHHLLLIGDSQANAQLSATYLPSSDTFLHTYFADDCAIHLRQIEHDLKVLRPGRRYADQAIDAIRALVALDSQKQQMELEEQDAKREKRLQKHLAILASGLAISGIAASTRSRPTEKFLQRHVPQYAKPPHQPPAEVLWLTDIALIALLGVMSALLVACLWDRTESLLRSLNKRTKP
jgi:hypothetical protein